MAKQKDFGEVSTERAYTRRNAGAVFDQTELSTNRRGVQGDPSEEERAERMSNLRTQGRKGCSLERINLAFTPENYEFIKVLYPYTHGKTRTMTGFINEIIEEYRLNPKNQERYERAKAFSKGMDEE